MYKAILNSIIGVEIFPIIGFILFFAVFIAIIFRTMRQDDLLMKRMANLPNEADHKE